MQQNKQLTLNDLVSYVYDKVIVYRNSVETDKVFEPFVNLYDGYLRDAPVNILSLSVETVGSHRNVLDICVKQGVL